MIPHLTGQRKALARAIERKKDPDYVSVSWGSQEEAINYYNEHGFIETLDRLVELGGVDAT